MKLNWYIIKHWIEDTFYYDPKIGIPNLFKWFKTIYNDRNWDYYYILKILRKKLETQEKYLKKNNIIDEKKLEKLSSELRYTINLIKKIMDDNYVDDKMIKHKEKWGETHISFVDDELSTKKLHLKRMIIIYDKDLTEDEQKQEREEFNSLIRESDTERSEDIKKVFLYIAEHIEEWWD